MNIKGLCSHCNDTKCKTSLRKRTANSQKKLLIISMGLYILGGWAYRTGFLLDYFLGVFF